MITTERLITVNDLAKELGVSKQTLFSKMRNGKLKGVKVFGKRMFRKEDIKRFYTTMNVKSRVEI